MTMLDEVRLLVVSVHGVESRGEWQRLVDPVFSGIHGLKHRAHVFGRFRFVNILVGPLRRWQIDKFHRQLSDWRKMHGGIRPSVVAHSFGTYIVTRALATYPTI